MQPQPANENDRHESKSRIVPPGREIADRRQVQDGELGLPAGLSLRIEGRAARLALCDARRGNVLTLPVAEAMRAALTVLESEQSIEVVIVEGEAGVFCSGADLPALYQLPNGRAAAARDFWRSACALVATMARLDKPVVALMDGIVIGGGLSLGGFATYRVVTERTRISLPQTAVGLVPDMGTSRLLARAPGAAGLYLGLTASSIGAADAIHAGFADGLINSGAIEGLCGKLSNPYAGGIEAILNANAVVPGPSPLAMAASGIDAAFARPTVAGILDALAASSEPWAPSSAAALATGSPLAMELALALSGRARGKRRLEDCLAAEFVFISKLIDCGEVFEGVKARLMETASLPAWLVARPHDVDAASLAPFLSPLLPGEGLAPASVP